MEWYTQNAYVSLSECLVSLVGVFVLDIKQCLNGAVEKLPQRICIGFIKGSVALTRRRRFQFVH
jgi:hypothetical protein